MDRRCVAVAVPSGETWGEGEKNGGKDREEEVRVRVREFDIATGEKTG